MENKKRVYCLYRVSKQEQAENDDLPMQKQACRTFAEQQGWEVVKEFYEKGVSGFKVSSTKRDAILEIQREAALGNFDILLVFLFDRLGRKDDETPFVVEWFIRNKIAVWSVNEGEQRLDTHTDKLLNYIRYWQASGESIKTSIRVKSGVARIVSQGWFAGGVAPFGYRLEKSGRINEKAGRETHDYVVAEENVSIVKTIFSKYANEGYGILRIVRELHAQGIVKANGRHLTHCNVANILKNQLYNGYVKRGETRTHVPRLQLIDDDLFNRVQELLKMRKKSNFQSRRVPMTTKSPALLSGNIFCGDCGARLNFSPDSIKQRMITGEIKSYNAAGYRCKGITFPHKKTCQQKYVSKRVDDVVRSVLQRVFERIRELPPSDTWEKQHKQALEALRNQIKTTIRNISKLDKELASYKNEVIKVIQGESSFTAEILNQLIREVEEKISKQNNELKLSQTELDESDSLYEKMKTEHIQIRSWSEIFDESSLEMQKMVVCSLIREIRVSRGYQIEIDFNISAKEFVDGVSLDEETENYSISVSN